MSALEAVGLRSLMELTRGRPDVVVALVDGPVHLDHPDLAATRIREVRRTESGRCTRMPTAACVHGTFVAGVLFGRRRSAAPAICPDCTLLLRPIFKETDSGSGEWPSATAAELSEAIVDCVNKGAHVVNISASFAQPSIRGERAIQDALDHAARRGVIVVAAAGNHSGSTAITRHPWVIPVVAYDTRGRPMDDSNLAGSIARRGLGAPGEKITSLGVGRVSMTFSGTSAAAPFVSGAVALLRSVFPGAASGDVKHALTRAHAPRRSTIVPPMLNASLAYHALREGERRG